MQSFVLTIILGALAGLITSGIVLGVKSFMSKVVLPWYENLVYHDVKFEGRWLGYSTISGEAVERVWDIQRQGHNFEATVTSTSGSDKGHVFLVKGSFKNLILTGTYAHKDSRNTARGSYAFKLLGDGHRFDGVVAYLATGTGTIEHASYTLIRKDEIHSLPTSLKSATAE